jgi:Patatin-like phospholipase
VNDLENAKKSGHTSTMHKNSRTILSLGSLIICFRMYINILPRLFWRGTVSKSQQGKQFDYDDMRHLCIKNIIRLSTIAQYPHARSFSSSQHGQQATKCAENEQPRGLNQILKPRAYNLCFGGSGWSSAFQLGFASELQLHSRDSLPPLIFSGASAGAIVSTALASSLSCQGLYDFILETVARTAATSSKPLEGHTDEWLTSALQERLPMDAYKLCTNRVLISVSARQSMPAKWPLRNVQVHEFKSNQHLIDVVRASCFIPGYSQSLVGRPIGVPLDLDYEKNVLCIDGGFTINCPYVQPTSKASERIPLVKTHTITSVRISPFPSLYDVIGKRAAAAMHLHIPQWNFTCPSPSLPVLAFRALIPTESTIQHLFELGQHAGKQFVDSILYSAHE